MACHILLGAIQTLTPATSPPDAAHFASALMKADLADWPAEGVSGGAYHKVIRWAFEKQGLYQLAGTKRPNNSKGRRRRSMSTLKTAATANTSFSPTTGTARQSGTGAARMAARRHEKPVAGVTNYAYVKIKNRGSEAATKVVVRAFHSRPAAGRLFPDDWQPMKTAQLAAANVPPKSSAEILVGPFEWVPSPAGHDCMLMVASATGDPSNIHNFSVGNSVPDWRLVPHDNNIALRSVCPVTGANAGRLVKDFSGISFQVKNPFNKPARDERQSDPAAIPASSAAGRFHLGRPVRPRSCLSPASHGMWTSGSAPAGTSARPMSPRKSIQSIEIIARANGIVVGGMSYPLRHKAKRPVKQKRKSRRTAKSRTAASAKSRAAAKRRRQRRARR